MRIERLSQNHVLSGFDCGIKSLNEWIVNHALENQRRDISRTFVLIDDSEEVIGYYSLSMGGVNAIDLPKKLGRGLPKYDVGLVLLARLAVATRSQGQKLGRDLMIDAIYHAAAAGEHAAARFIAVDPIDETARTFYANFGFQDIVGDERGRMFLRIDEALEAFNEATESESDIP
jgi:predicted N-acetyltransferase YhbS